MLSRVPGKDNLYVGGIWTLNPSSPSQPLRAANITHVLSVIKYSFEGWGEEGKAFKHLSIDIDDDSDSDLLAYFPAAVRFIDGCLHPHSMGPTNEHHDEYGDDAPAASSSAGAVYVHCAMGKSRSVSCVVAYLLYKYPHRFSSRAPALETARARQERRAAEARDAVGRALQLVREARSGAEPNPGFLRQLALWWEMDCPADEGALENHPVYQKWLYERLLQDARRARMAPDAEQIRFEDEAEARAGEGAGGGAVAATSSPTRKEVRCKKCRRTLVTPQFRVAHHGPSSGPGSGSSSSGDCAHIFVETLSWMRPALEGGALEGRLNCPNPRCGANVGRFAWQGLQCNCREWVVPAFALARGRVDEVFQQPQQRSTNSGPSSQARAPPGRHGSL